MAGKGIRAKRDKAFKKAFETLYQPELYAPETGDRTENPEHPLEEPGHYLVQRQTYREGKLISFFIGHYRESHGERSERFSIDTRHGSLHEHIHGHRRSNDSREIRPLYNQVDVQESYDDALERVLEKYRMSVGRE